MLYRVINVDNNETIAYTSDPVYIRVSDNGSFTQCAQEVATGIAVDSVAYNLIGHNEIENTLTVIVSRYDDGKVLGEASDLAKHAAPATALAEFVESSCDDTSVIMKAIAELAEIVLEQK